MYDFKKECKDCPLFSGTDCTLQSPEFGCVKKTRDAAKALIEFLKCNTGENENALVEIKCNGEDSDLYGKHVAALLSDIEDAVM